MTFTCLYFLPQVMVKFTRKARGNLVTLIEIGKHLSAFLDMTDPSSINFIFSFMEINKNQSIKKKSQFINNDFLKHEQADILKSILKFWHHCNTHSQGKVKNNAKIWFIQSLQISIGNNKGSQIFQVNTFAQSEPICTFRNVLTFPIKSIALIRQ